MDLAQSIRRKIFKSTLVEEHHIGSGLFSFDQVQRSLIPDVQLVPQDRDILV